MAWHVYNDCHIQHANNTYNIHKWLPRRVIISLLFLYNFLALALVSPSIFQRNKNFLENRQNLNYEKIRVNIFFCSKVWNIDQEQVGESLSYFNYDNTSEESLSSWWILVTWVHNTSEEEDSQVDDSDVYTKNLYAIYSVLIMMFLQNRIYSNIHVSGSLLFTC